jgi:hypothetical protein
MDSEWIIGALAFMTIGGILALAVFHFGFHLKDPKNLEATKRVAADRESATTAVSSESTGGRSLRQRLDEAPSINDRLSKRPVGRLGVWDLMLNTKWSVLSSTLKGQPPSHNREGV